MASRKQKKSEIVHLYCLHSTKKYFQETTLHGLKYFADTSLTIFEKLFFFSALTTTVIIAVNLISNVYVMWDSTPVIIGMSPRPTSILKVPFPSMTVCNMNHVLKSKVTNYSQNSPEFDVLRLFCYTQTEYNNFVSENGNFSNNDLNISDFIIEHAQPCSRMLLYCQISSIAYDCSGLFREVITDEGLCCVFNVLHPKFLYKGKYDIIKKLTNSKVTAVSWDPEKGYQSKLPENYYPVPAAGTGVSMGMSIILNAELDEYYCSSTNGPGIKISVHNPLQTPPVRESGISVPLGFETRFRIDATYSKAAPEIRSISRNRRQCTFINEKILIFYKYYTQENCEIECLTIYLYQQCKCIPFDYPTIYSNSSVCTVKQSYCINKAKQKWIRESLSNLCLKSCLPSCFELNFFPDSFCSRLTDRNYSIQNSLLRKMTKDHIQRNIAVVHIYYRESVFYGDLKNVFIGLTEFLSNIGGIMGLLLGFSLIWIAEIVYYAIFKPISEFCSALKLQNFS